MAWINTRGTRLSQPQGPVEIDFANSIANGIRGAVTPLSGESTAATIAPTPYGEGWVFNPSVQTIVEKQNVLFDRNSPGTLLVFGRLQIDGTYRTLISFGGASTGGGINWSGSTSGGRITLGGIADYNGPANYIDNGLWRVYALTFRAGTAARFFRSGSLIGSSGSIGTPNAAAKPLTLGDAYNGTTYVGGRTSGEIALAVYWGRVLSDAEIASISANPWQLFKPVNRRVYFDVGGGAGGASQSIAFTLDDATANISQTLGHSQSLSTTLDSVTASVSQTLRHGQTLGITLDDVTANIAQEIAGAKSQSLAITLDSVTAAISQTARHSQSLAVTLDDVAVTISQSAASPNKDQSLAITLDDVAVSISQTGPASIVDTHDGFWNREYRKMFEWVKKKPTVKQVVEEIVKPEPIAAIQAVKQEIKAKFDLPNNDTAIAEVVAKNVKLQQFIARQLIERAKVEADEQDIEDILMLI